MKEKITPGRQVRILSWYIAYTVYLTHKFSVSSSCCCFNFDTRLLGCLQEGMLHT